MSVLCECSRCWLRFATSNKTCPRCGVRMTPLIRRFVAEVRDLNGKKVYKSLGNVSLEEARAAEGKLKIESKQIRTPTQTWGDVVTSYLQMLAAKKNH